MTRIPLRKLWRAKRGATIVEFGIILIPLLTLLMGALDLGHLVYMRALAEGSLERAARRATVGNQTKQQVVAIIKDEVRTILPAGSRDDPAAVTVTPLSYFNFSAVGGGERITGDTAPLGQYNATDCYEDRNNNGRYDATGGGGDDLGSADDIIYYNVVISVPRLFSFLTTLGLPANNTIESRTLIRNQPYGEQQVRIRCA